MPIDYSKLSDQELEAIANDDYSKLSDATLNAILEEEKKSKVATPAKSTEGPVVPAVGAIGAIPAIPTGYNAGAVREVAQPILDNLGITKTIQSYRANPLYAAADVLIGGTTGLPPVAALKSAESIYGTYKGAKQAASTANEILSQSSQVPVLDANGQPVLDAQGRPITKPETRDVWRALQENAGKSSDFSKKLSEVGGWSKDNPRINVDAVKSWLSSDDPLVKEALRDPLNRRLAEELGAGFPSTAQKVGRVLAPVGKAALNVAGKALAPIGMAVEGAQGIEQAKRGDYTGAGISALGVGSMFNPAGIIAQPGLAIMGQANQNFRQQTPQQQRESTMDALSGTAPGMAGEYFPQYTEEDNIRKAVKRKAAERVLGPVAPR